MKTVQRLVLTVILTWLTGCSTLPDADGNLTPLFSSDAAAPSVPPSLARSETTDDVFEDDVIEYAPSAVLSLVPIEALESPDEVLVVSVPPDIPCNPEVEACVAPTYSATSVQVPRTAAPYQAQIIKTGVADVPANTPNAMPKWQRQHVCGASLIAQDWVITAAHCFNTSARSRSTGKVYNPYRSCATDKAYKDISTGKFAVRVGISNISRADGQIREIEAIYCRDYAIRPKAGDLALVKLKPAGAPLEVEERSPLMPIFTQISYDKASATLLGYARTKQDDAYFTGFHAWDVGSGRLRDWRHEAYAPETPLAFYAPGRVRVVKGAYLTDIDVVSGQEISRHEMAGEIRGFKEFPQQNRVLIWTRGGVNPDKIEIWDRSQMGLRTRLEIPDGVGANAIAGFNPLRIEDVFINATGSVIAVLDFGGLVVWPKQNGAFGPARYYASKTEPTTESGLAFSDQSSIDLPIFSAGYQYVVVRDVQTKRLSRINLASDRHVHIRFPERIQTAKASPDTSRVAVLDANQRLHLYDMNTGRSLINRLRTQPVKAYGFSSRGNRLYTLHDKNRLQIWNARTGSRVQEIRVTEDVELNRATFVDAAGWRVMAHARSGVSYIWDVDQLRDPLRMDHSLPMTQYILASNGRRLLAGNGFGNAEVWDTATGKALLRVFQRGEVTGLDLIDDKTLFVSASNGQMNFWDIPTETLTMRLTQDRGPFDLRQVQEADSKLGYIAPEYMSQNDKDGWETLLAFGWGRTGISRAESGNSAVLRMLGLNPWSAERCEAHLREVNARTTLDSSFFCAQAEQRKTCQGDSGGPVISIGPDYFSKKKLVGIISGSNHNCKAENAPGFYTDVGQYFHWITDKICADPQTGQRAKHLCRASGPAF